MLYQPIQFRVSHSMTSTVMGLLERMCPAPLKAQDRITNAAINTAG